MAIIRTIQNGPCTVRIHDDYILNEEEKKKVLKEIAKIAYKALYNQEIEKRKTEKEK